MCGIAGINYSKSSSLRGDYDRLMVDILKQQNKRGPDFSSSVRFDSDSSMTILGHNRLSIIDLKEHSNQPLWDHTRRFCLTFNGEIYNYIELRQQLVKLGHCFLTDSDSEVILEGYKRWGEEVLNKINGMFAFAIYDMESSELLIARDRFGVKPLIYYHTNSELVFGSSALPIAKFFKLAPNIEYLSRGLRYGIYDGFGDCQFDGLASLDPGSYLKVKYVPNGGICLSSHVYYDLNERVEDRLDSLANISEEEALINFFDVFSNAVDIRLRADVPIAISLSGGLDSSSIAALATKISKYPLTGYTLGNKDNSNTEGPLVEELSKHLGIDVNYIDHTNFDITNAFWDTFAAQESPIPSYSVIGQNMVYQSLAENGVKVVLGGQGGDEILMGYRKFNVFHFESMRKNGDYLGALSFLLGLLPMLLSEIKQLPMYWEASKNYRRGGRNTSVLNFDPCSSIQMSADKDCPLWVRSILDITKMSVPSLLRYEDRNSMYHSVESRLPFMDYRLVEMSIALPTALKLKNGYGKWLLRKAVNDRIPNSIRLARYKRGFDVEHNVWVDGSLGRMIRRVLGEGRRSIRQWINSPDDIDILFSNDRLKNNPLAFPEATSLMWLLKYLLAFIFMADNVVIAHLSSVHPSRDIRIFVKECKGLKRGLQADVYFVVPEERDYFIDGVNILAVNINKTRISRILFTPITVFFKALKINPDIVHFHDPELILIGILFRFLGKKVIYDIHEDLPRDILSKDWIHPLLRHSISWLAAFTEWVGAHLFFSGIVSATPTIAARFPQKKVTLVQNYPKITEFSNIVQKDWGSRKKQLVYVGVIDMARGVIENINALSLLGNQEVNFLLAGPFSSDALKSECESLVGWQQVNYFPWLTRDEIVEALAESVAGLVVLHPTPAYIDSLPIKMFEYMLAGIPVIASDFPLWREIIEGSQCGILVDPLNPKETTEAIQWLIDNPGLAEEMGGNGKKAVAEKYNWEQEEIKLLRLYKKLQQ